MTKQLTPFSEVITVYCENHAKHVNTVYMDKMQSSECLDTGSDATYCNFTRVAGFSSSKKSIVNNIWNVNEKDVSENHE